MELVFVELPKFKLNLEELNSLTDKWMYFLQHTRELAAIPATMGAVAAIRQAFEVANQANLSPEELDELDHQLIFIEDQRNAIAWAAKQTVRGAQVEIVQKLLSVLDDAAISQATGLPIGEIKSIRSAADTPGP